MANMVGNKKIKYLLLYALAFAVLIIMVFPYLYMVLGSLAPWDEVDRTIIPSELTLRSYEWLFFGGMTRFPDPGCAPFSTVCL